MLGVAIDRSAISPLVSLVGAALARTRAAPPTFPFSGPRLRLVLYCIQFKPQLKGYVLDARGIPNALRCEGAVWIPRPRSTSIHCGIKAVKPRALS